MTTIAEMNARALEARIASANLSPDQIRLRREIDEHCQAISKYAAWTLDPDEDFPGDTAKSLVEYAHELLDLVHEFKNTVKK